MNRIRRTVFFVDREVQGALLLRVAWYWLFCLFTISALLICWNAFVGPPQRFSRLVADLLERYAPAVLASLVLLPLVLLDALRLSNRFVGPVLRLRTALRAVADGQSAQPLAFRDDDFWQEIATDFNRAASRLAPAAERSRPTEEMPASCA